MIERRLVRQLEKAAGRFRHVWLVMAWALVWVVAAFVAVLALASNRFLGWYSPLAVPLLAGAACMLAVVAAWLAWRSARDYQWVAQQVEDAYPDLRAGLLAAVNQRPQLPNARFSYLQASVIQQSLHHAYANTWKRVVPATRLFAAHTAHIFALLAFLAALLALNSNARPPAIAEAGPADPEVALLTDVDFSVAVEPGDTEVERGTSLLVLARFTGPAPLEATLVYETAGESIRVAMNKPLRDPVYGARIAEVDGPLAYRVEYAQEVTNDFQVTVFEFPTLVRADAELSYPGYTALETRLVQDVRRVSAVEGTRLRLLCYLNKEIAEARLEPRSGAPVALQATGEDVCYAVDLTLTKSERYKLELVDTEGRRNKQPPTFVISVLPNKPPDVKLVQPSRDTQVSPIEELDLRANVYDDFGVSRFGLAYSLGAEDARDVILGESAPAKQRTAVEHLVAFEELGAEPDQLLSYHFWAEDTGPDGQVRRVSSDMFFAEVRHFEEIFRQGQQPPGGEPQQQQGGGQEAQKLAELQKQIVSATWKVIRRETKDTPSDKFAADVELLAESQAAAMAQADELKEKLRDAQSLRFMQQVIEHMSKAYDTLTAALDGPAIDELRPALSAEQAAYQALLKLRAREFQVTQSQQSQSSSSSSSSSQNRAQQQLQQLQLDQEKNRYETERQAQSQQEQQDSEDRQIMNRLRELARRQGDLNDRLKELQSSLEEAQSEEEREEILRQLKRLQEEQQQILRDTEELQERMEKPENQERMAESQQQLQETRDNVRQASEALEEGRVSRALASGTRAETELEEMKEDFRRKTSDRFNEEMREMRQQARELDETQQELSERLSDLDSPKERSTSLRESTGREQIVEGLEGQKERLTDLVERMRDTVLDAEETEPLLADQLYDTVRDAQQKDLDSSLNTARRMLEYGFLDDARKEEQQARSGISELREGVERAAESVLGDETEALRRAQKVLQELSAELNSELERENPDSSQQQGRSRSQQPQEGEQQGQPSEQQGQPSEQQGQPSEQQGQPSEQQGQPSEQQGQPSEQQGQPSEQQGQPSEQQGQPSEQQGQPSEQQGQPSEQQGQPSQQQGQPSEQQGQPSEQQLGQSPQDSQSASSQPASQSRGGFERAFGGGQNDQSHVAPLGGEDFREWSDRLRDVEEMIDEPALRAEAARIRDRARGFRQDLKRHSKEPEWDLVELQVAKPLAELRDRVAEELLRRTSKDAILPLDRDPIPSKFTEQVRKYYERLGAGQ